MDECRYRIVQRKPGGSWQHWQGRVFGDLDSAERMLSRLADNARFFRWSQEYLIERQPFGEWEGC